MQLKSAGTTHSDPTNADGLNNPRYTITAITTGGIGVNGVIDGIVATL